VSTPGQLYFSAPIARPTGSAAITAPGQPAPPADLIIPGTDADTNPATTPPAEVSTPGQLYFSAPIARPTGSAAITAPVGWPPEDALTRSCLEVCLGPSNAGRVAWPKRPHRLHSAALA